MSFFSDEQNSELRELFFESAAELVQALNEEGLEWEKDPADAEIPRRIRRTVHTLKGDAAAAGFAELSQLAHVFEDALTGDKISQPALIAELVLRAADTFSQMLSLYREGKTPPAQDDLLARVRKVVAGPKTETPQPAAPFRWSEYEQLLIASAIQGGERVLQVTVDVDPTCPGGVAVQMVRNALEQSGSIVCVAPETPGETVDRIRVVVATARDTQWLTNRCLVPGVTKAAHIEALTPDVVLPTVRHELAAPIIARAVAPAATEKPAEKAQTTASEPVAQFNAPESSLRVDSARIDAALNLLGELIIGKSMLMQTMSEFYRRYSKDPLRARFDDSLAFIGRTLGDLQKSIMKIRMVPVEQLFRRFPRTVRDLSRSCGKEVELQVAGAATDLDKSILDLLAEPLSHIVRNAVDHGIETPDARSAAGKPRLGTILLNAYHQGNHIVIECSDDGRGIDRKRLVEKAIQSGIIDADEAERLTDNEAFALIFHPGLSTAAQVTAISGRGVGMDVVKTVLDRLKGQVTIESHLGLGTTFRLKVPLTVAIIKALMFRAGDQLYAVPLAAVIEITRSKSADIHVVDKHEVLQLRGETLTLVRPERLNRRYEREPRKFFVVVISHNDRKFGMIVDSLIGEEELVIKPLDHPLVATEFISGASILGDGSVVLILNVQAVVSRLNRRAEVSFAAVSA